MSVAFRPGTYFHVLTTRFEALKQHKYASHCHQGSRRPVSSTRVAADGRLAFWRRIDSVGSQKQMRTLREPCRQQSTVNWRHGAVMRMMSSPQHLGMNSPSVS